MMDTGKHTVRGAVIGGLAVAAAWGMSFALQNASEEPVLIGGRTLMVNGTSENIIGFTQGLSFSGTIKGYKHYSANGGRNATVELSPDATGATLVAVTKQALDAGLSYSFIAAVPPT